MRSRSTCDCGSDDAYIAEHRVSISDEKPLHMRRRSLFCPLSLGAVSISDEKPLHMRRCSICYGQNACKEFQSQMRSRSTCDHVTFEEGVSARAVSISDEKPLHMRRSGMIGLSRVSRVVSISDEKPLHMRRRQERMHRL